MKLKDKLKLIRKHLSLTQDQMAEKLGLTSDSRRSRISEWETGIGEPKRDILIKYSDIANLDVKKLIDDREIIAFRSKESSD
jgi:transcriptional regulator with XRE-family HTH domain